MSPAHGRAEEGRQGVPPGAVRVRVPCPSSSPPPPPPSHPQVSLTKVMYE